MNRAKWLAASYLEQILVPAKEGVRKALSNYYLFTNRNFEDDYSLPGGYKRIYHYHIRKNAGSSVNSAFLTLGGEQYATVAGKLSSSLLNIAQSGDKTYANRNRTFINRGRYYFACSHHPHHKLRIPSDTFTITTFRDPVKRVVSHYNMLIEFLERNPKTSHLDASKEFLWLGNSFSDFIKNVPREHLVRQLYMFSRKLNVEEAYENISGLSYFFFVDDFNSGFSELSDILQLKLTVNKEMASRKKRVPEQRDLDLLKEKLQDEYILMGRLREFKGYQQ